MNKPADTLANWALGSLLALVLVEVVSQILLYFKVVSGWEAVAVYMWGTVIAGFGFGVPVLLGIAALWGDTNRLFLAVSSVALGLGMFVLVFLVLIQVA
jgi:hypothetical protein